MVKHGREGPERLSAYGPNVTMRSYLQLDRLDFIV